MEDVRAVAMNEDAGCVMVIEGVAAHMIAFIDDKDTFIGLGGKPLCEDAARKASADDEVVWRSAFMCFFGADGVFTLCVRSISDHIAFQVLSQDVVSSFAATRLRQSSVDGWSDCSMAAANDAASMAIETRPSLP